MSINSYLIELASELIIRDNEEDNIQRSINTLRTRLTSYFGSEIIEQFCFGSYTRGTILPRKADEDSDIDYMIVFKNTEGYKPESLFRRLKSFVEYRYSRSEIYRDSPTIVLELNHIKFELVPACYPNLYPVIKGYKIPAPRSSYEEWISTNPNEFNQQLTSKNIYHKSCMKPLIRILKYWNSLNGKIYSSYELEQHIINQNYFYCSNLRDYFYSAVDTLPTIGLSIYNFKKVNKFKSSIRDIKDKETLYPYTVESALKEIIPRT